MAGSGSHVRALAPVATLKHRDQDGLSNDCRSFPHGRGYRFADRRYATRRAVASTFPRAATNSGTRFRPAAANSGARFPSAATNSGTRFRRAATNSGTCKGHLLACSASVQVLSEIRPACKALARLLVRVPARKRTRASTATLAATPKD